MTASNKNNVHLYEALQDIETSIPYTAIDAKELTLIIRRLVSWSQMLVTHPDTTTRFGDLSTTCIQLATDLRSAMKMSEDAHTYPNVVLPMSKYLTAMRIYKTSESLHPAIAEMIEQEIRRWEEPTRS